MGCIRSRASNFLPRITKQLTWNIPSRKSNNNRHWLWQGWLPCVIWCLNLYCNGADNNKNRSRMFRPMQVCPMRVCPMTLGWEYDLLHNASSPNHRLGKSIDDWANRYLVSKKFIWFQICGASGCCYTPWMVGNFDEGQIDVFNGPSNLGECHNFLIRDDPAPSSLGKASHPHQLESWNPFFISL